VPFDPKDPLRNRESASGKIHLPGQNHSSQDKAGGDREAREFHISISIGPPLKLISTTQGLPALEDIKGFQKAISECPDEKFNQLSQDYLKSLLELASIINYRIKTC
jgi:hypothetical protein